MRQLYPVPTAPVPAIEVPGDGQATDELVTFLAERYAFPAGQWVKANMVASVDGAIAVQGRSGGLGGPADRIVFRVLRSLADVVLVGAGTARAERYGQVRPRDLWPWLRSDQPATPPVAVLTRRLDLALDSRLFGGQDAPGGPEAPRTIVLTTELASKEQRKAAAEVAEVIVTGEHDVTAQAAVAALTGLGYRRILTEGGPGLLGELAAAGLLDELCLTISPLLEGGYSPGRVTTASTSRSEPPRPTGMRLAGLLEDDSFLLSRYVRAGN